MTTPSNNLKALESHASTSTSTSTTPGFLSIWGVPLAVFVLAAMLAALAWWGSPNVTGLVSMEMRISALVKLFVGMVVVLAAHGMALLLGLYRKLGRWIENPNDKDAATRATKANKRDPRLAYLREELRTSVGWRWRYAMPWLMLTGDSTLIDHVAPDLKQFAVLRVGDTILVHDAPDGIDPETWRKQLRRLRRARPVDAIIAVMRAGETGPVDEERPRALSTLARDLGWAAPVTFLHAVSVKGNRPDEFHAVGAFIATPLNVDARASAESLTDELSVIEKASADTGVVLLDGSKPIFYLAEVSQYIDVWRERIVTSWQTLCASKWRRVPLAGVMFAPVFATPAVPTPVPAEQADVAHEAAERLASRTIAPREQPLSLQPVWREIGTRVDPRKGRRVGFHWPNVLATLLTIGVFTWIVAMTISFIGNRSMVQDARATVDAALAAQPGTPVGLRTQLELQQQIDTLEYRRQHGAPWYLRAGLNRNDELLAALWQPYATVAARNLRDPIAHQLEASLAQFSQARADARVSTDDQRHGYDALKAYLMLTQPQHADAAFLTKQLPAAWPAIETMRTGEWLDTSQRLASFYANHLRAHPEWRLTGSNDLVNLARNTLVNQIGLQNSDDTLYQSVLEQAKGKYADMTLPTLLNGADARGLFTSTQTVPGVYTRAAWDGMISEAIDKAAKEGRVGADWVLTDEKASRIPGAELEAHEDVEEVKQRLRARYFTEYTAAWQAMLNSFQWQAATNLSSAITQLTRLTDAQTSPLIALMKSVQYQAEAGRPSQALTDTLVRKAQDIIGTKTGGPGEPVVNPLDKPFGPLLALMGDDVVTGTGGKANGKSGKNAADFSGVSLAHFLTVATTMRLKLQQIATSADAQAMARQMAQAVFQGKLSELTQARDDAALTAASLGSQWAGLGDALFARPLDVAWQTILQPAAASLNEAWRLAVAAPFASSFDGHYPFADTNADASFVELGRYIKPDTGLIARFVTTQLAGILQSQGSTWAPNDLAPQALQFDPEFLSALRQLSMLGAQLYAQGDASYRLQIMPHPTPDVTRSILTLDGTKIEYFNQLEMFTPIVWPGNGQNGRTTLTWESDTAGTRIAFQANGDWSFVRLLGTAKVKALDSTSYALTFNEDSAYPLHYDLKAQVGAGPLDLLRLRGFKMPQRVFIIGKGGAIPVLPPLPPELQ
ncbi:ImcF domain-containing protein [Caballeronia catudaia]|uniref:ImcF domain-containing protein n=1 Tax=Caballeronia catudaia TaxID=1777136 RepID=A0A158B2P9_9BURK|nr:ImcF-related family protein [Caballeronia catudaia]SAK64335.1 ImcF domain-containing protein [Caballeronia catudaia]